MYAFVAFVEKKALVIPDQSLAWKQWNAILPGCQIGLILAASQSYLGDT